MIALPPKATSALGHSPFATAHILTIWNNRRLIARLARRDIEARYRGSALGLAWAVVNPLLLMAVYTFVFTVVFGARWGGQAGTADFALFMLSGLLLFNVFSESIARAPGLMLENVSYIKKLVFPLEIMPVVVVAGALVNAALGFAILLVFQIALRGLPPPTILLLPVVVLPLCLFTLGLSWFLASVGVFLRDLRQMMGVVVSVMLFLSPIFYPVSNVPEAFRTVITLNPLTMILEGARDVLFWGKGLDPLTWLVYLAVAWVWAMLGHAWFMKTRKAFADVV
ncbi:ABC transporter permease [Azospirillum doebereinerae]